VICKFEGGGELILFPIFSSEPKVKKLREYRL